MENKINTTYYWICGMASWLFGAGMAALFITGANSLVPGETQTDILFYKNHECQSLYHVSELQELIGTGVSRILLIAHAEATRQYNSETKKYSPISASNPIILVSSSGKEKWDIASVNIGSNIVYDSMTLYTGGIHPNIRKPLTCVYDAPKGLWRSWRLDTPVDTYTEKLRDMMNTKLVAIVPEIVGR